MKTTSPVFDMSAAKTQRRQGWEKMGISFTLRLCALAGENLKLFCPTNFTIETYSGKFISLNSDIK
jgi:hypothetical protein